jgi:transposase InsO family protein
LKAKARRPFVVKATRSDHNLPVAKNVLNRGFYPNQANAVWTADITYIHTQEGWLFLAVVIDLFSHRVVGWATAEHMRTELVVNALRMALRYRRPGGPLLHHTDRGVQYASETYQMVLAEHGIEPSLSRKGDCYDNAVTESFFSTLKRERTHHESYPSRQAARRSLFKYIEVSYNRRRLHSTLGCHGPEDYDLRHASRPT